MAGPSISKDAAAAATRSLADDSGGSSSSSDSSRFYNPSWLGKRIGRFRLIDLLGKGAFGRVFLAEDVDLRRRVALKVITAGATARSIRAEAQAAGEAMDTSRLDAAVNEAVDRMIHEARAAARIEHHGVVQVYQVGRLEGGGGGYIAMELLEGGTLQDVVRAAGPMDVPRACALIADAAEALGYGHEQGVVHRDVKPANLMLSRSGRCKVADFGLACVKEAGEEKGYFAVAGTALYMAPEIILGRGPGAKSDQYALAATLYTVLAGRPPFRGERKQQILLAHVRSPLPDLRELRPDVDQGLWRAIRRAMSKNPARRFETIQQFGQALRLYTVSLQAEALDEFAASLAQVLGPPVEPAGPASRGARGSAARSSSATRAKSPWRSSANLLGALQRKLRITSASLAGFARRSPWSVGAAAALAVLVVIALWAGGAFSGTPPVVAGPKDAASTDSASPRQDAIPAPASEESAHSESAAVAAERQPAIMPAEEATTQPLPNPPPAQRDVAAAAPEPADFIPAADYERLLRIAQGKEMDHPDRRVAVGGRVTHARASSTGNVFRIYFEGPQRDKSFGVVYFPDRRLFERIAEKFGGADGSVLEGKLIRVTGEVSIYQHNPQIIVDSPDQIEVIEGQ